MAKDYYRGESVEISGNATGNIKELGSTICCKETVFVDKHGNDYMSLWADGSERWLDQG